MPVLGFTITVTVHNPVFTPCRMVPETLPYSVDVGATLIERVAPVVKRRPANMVRFFAETEAVVLI